MKKLATHAFRITSYIRVRIRRLKREFEVFISIIIISNMDHLNVDLISCGLKHELQGLLIILE